MWHVHSVSLAICRASFPTQLFVVSHITSDVLVSEAEYCSLHVAAAYMHGKFRRLMREPID